MIERPQNRSILVRVSVLAVATSLSTAAAAPPPIEIDWDRVAPKWLFDEVGGDPVVVVGIARAGDLANARRAADRDALDRLYTHLRSRLGIDAPIGDLDADPATFLKRIDRHEGESNGEVAVAVRYKMKEKVEALTARLGAPQTQAGVVAAADLHGAIRVRSVSGRFAGFLQPGDVLLAINDELVEDAAAFGRMGMLHLNDASREVRFDLRRPGAAPIRVVAPPIAVRVEDIRDIRIAPTCGPCCHGSPGCDRYDKIPLPKIRDRR